MTTSVARRLWAAAETVHAVTYFHPVALARIVDTGTRGFWMGYFAARLAPLGRIGSGTATAVCCNFSPARTVRALPDAWDFVAPADVLAARTEGAVAALRACGVTDPATDVLRQLDALVLSLDRAGRPLGSANLDLDLPEDPVGHLWQLCTTLREHRGDVHVALLIGAGLDGCEVNVLVTAVTGLDPTLLRESRGWTTPEWDAAVDRLVARGLLDADDDLPVPTTAGADLHRGIEARTDELASAGYLRTVGPGELEELVDALAAAAAPVVAAGVIPVPNPIGLRIG